MFFNQYDRLSAMLVTILSLVFFIFKNNAFIKNSI